MQSELITLVVAVFLAECIRSSMVASYRRYRPPPQVCLTGRLDGLQDPRITLMSNFHFSKSLACRLQGPVIMFIRFGCQCPGVPIQAPSQS